MINVEKIGDINTVICMSVIIAVAVELCPELSFSQNSPITSQSTVYGLTFNFDPQTLVLNLLHTILL
jgi:hypothetical protein